MFQTFKNLELARYHISSKFEKTISEHLDKSTENNEQVLAAVFSAALSLLFAFLLDEKIVTIVLSETWQKILYAIGLGGCYVVSFILLFYGFKKIYRCLLKYASYDKIHSVSYSSKQIKEVVDDFDIIAFDDLLAAFEFIQHIENADIELTTFYFHELLYYLKTAIEKTKTLIDAATSKQAINSSKKINGVDLFRIFNAYSLMKKVVAVVNNIIEPPDGSPTAVQIYDKRLEEILKIQIKDISCDIDKVGDRCVEILNEHYPEKGV